jgi:hypothetical protein
MYLCLRLLLPPKHRQNSVETLVGSQPGVEALAGKPLASSNNITPLAAFAGALAFQFSDLFIVHFGNLNMIAVAAWLPLVFLLFQRSLVQASFGLAAASGAILAIATLAGHIQITLFILLTLGLYTLWHIGCQVSNAKRQTPDMEHPEPGATPHAPRPLHRSLRFTLYVLRPLLHLLLTLLITIGLSALLLLPAYEMSQYTSRAELPYPEAARYSLHPAQLIGLLVPNYFGRDPALHWGPWERVETGYIGIMTLLLALAGALLYPSRLKFFFIALALIALLLAMGGYTPLHGWLYALAPGFDQLRAPARFILLLDFSLAVLAAFGLNHLLQPLNEAAKSAFTRLLKLLTWSLGGLIVIAGPLSYFALLITQDRNPAIFNRATGAAAGVAIFAFFTIAALIILHARNINSLREKWFGIAAIMAIGLDLFTLGYNVDVGHTNPASGFHHPDALAFLEADPNFFRLEVTTDVWHAWQPNTALLHDKYDAWGLYNPLTLADSTLYWSGAPPRSTGRYNFLGIKYIIASKAGAPADGAIVPVFEGDPHINIYLNQDALARVLFVGQAQVVANHDAAWAAIRADDFEPNKKVVLEAGQSLDTRPISTLAILHYGLDTVTIAVETDQPGYLVLSDAYYPGWQAAVDGRPEPIRRANYAFRAVYVPAGQHTVEFIFAPLIWQIGLVVSGLTLLTLAGWLAWRWKNART